MIRQPTLRSNAVSPDSEILALRARIADLKNRVDYLCNHLGITYVQDRSMEDARVIDMLKRGNKIEAIKIYREIHN